MMEERTSTKLGEYTLTCHLAHGGMSEVYLAQTEKSEEVYALKLVEQTDEECYQRFQREIQALCNVQHTHILPVLDYGEENGFSYYVMPYIEQGTLKDLLCSGLLSLEEAGNILTQIGEALQFLHETGVVHRDIKPANILLDREGRAWLADLGLVKEVESGLDLTGAGSVIGTPSYMAPELMSESASVSSDVYALGVVLYEMLTGHTPFDADTPVAIWWKHAATAPPAPSLSNPQISSAVEGVILRALAKDPGSRFGTAAEFVAAYKQALLFPHSALNWFVDVAEAATVRYTPLNAPVPVEQGYRRALIVGLLLSMLLVLGCFTLAFEIQGLPGNSAQATTISHSVATPTATSHTRPSPTATENDNVQEINIPVQPGPPDNHHKHHGRGGD